MLSRSITSVAQSCPTLCDPMHCSMPILTVHQQLLEFTQTHVHWVCDAIQPSHHLLSPSPPALNLSQHQSHFKWVSSSHWTHHFVRTYTPVYMCVCLRKSKCLQISTVPGHWAKFKCEQGPGETVIFQTLLHRLCLQFSQRYYESISLKGLQNYKSSPLI